MHKVVFGTSKNLPLSKAVRCGDVWYLSGEVGIDPATGEIVPGGIAAQTAQALENLKRTLEEIGSSMDKVVKTTVFLTDVNDFAEMNVVYKRYFATDPPARSTVGIAGLARPGLVVEIELIAMA